MELYKEESQPPHHPGSLGMYESVFVTQVPSDQDFKRN